MKGKLIKIFETFFVEYSQYDDTIITIEVYPGDCDGNELLKKFWSNTNYVDFEIIEVCLNYDGAHLNKDCSCKENLQAYAKLIKTPNQTQTIEITDEDITNAAWEYEPRQKLDPEFIRAAFINGAKWYRQQLKNKV